MQMESIEAETATVQGYVWCPLGIGSDHSEYAIRNCSGSGTYHGIRVLDTINEVVVTNPDPIVADAGDVKKEPTLEGLTNTRKPDQSGNECNSES